MEYKNYINRIFPVDMKIKKQNFVIFDYKLSGSFSSLILIMFSLISFSMI